MLTTAAAVANTADAEATPGTITKPTLALSEKEKAQLKCKFAKLKAILRARKEDEH